MDPERWQQLRHILGQAIHTPPADLQSYLDHACAHDKELRHEVESVLTHKGGLAAGGDWNLPTDQVTSPAAHPSSGGSAGLPQGTHLASYVIEAFQGSGGMGVVYRARDEILQRQVAIKVLAPGMLHGTEARRRFLTEARALAQISHPNILTIYDVDRSENVDFIAMEWIDGKRLDQLIPKKGMPLNDALKYAIQIADALTQAHAKGVTHRDLKPSNVMITADGRVKVLDFGLAKIAAAARADELTGDSAVTVNGRVMGTAAYMSPEQAEGKAVDWRSDIFSFGSLLYEMVSGRRAFRGDSAISTIASIIKEDPARLSDRIPAKLRYLVERCMRKQPERRFQAMADVQVELEEIYEERTAAPVARLLAALRSGAPKLPYAALLLTIVIMAAIVLWRFATERSDRSQPPDFVLSEITSGIDWDGDPEISPDGTRIAFASNRSGNSEIYVADIQGKGQQAITTDPAEDSQPAWFPDGTAIAFTSYRGDRMGIWKTGAQGGGATPLIENARDPAISPDQTMIAFVRLSPNTYQVAVARLDNLEEVQTLTDSSDTSVIASNPAWSPDGRTICYMDRQDFWLVDVSGGRPKRLTSDGQYKDEPVWSPDGRRIYYSSAQGAAMALWRINSSGGTPERVTDGTGQESHPSVSRDGKRLVYATDKTVRGIVMLNRESGTMKSIPGARQRFMPSISQDGTKVVSISSPSGADGNIWVQQLNHGQPVGGPNLLVGLPDGILSHPTVSPDGRWIACYRILGNKRELMMLSFAGGKPFQLTRDPPQCVTPAWSPDGSVLAFATRTAVGSEIRTVPVANGRPTREPQTAAVGSLAYGPTWSPDGRRLAFIDSINEQSEVWIAPADGSAASRRVTSGAGARRVRWDAKTDDLLVSGTWGGDRVTLRKVSLASEVSLPFIPEVDFGGAKSYGLFDVSADGRWLVFTREEVAGQVWMRAATSGLY